MEKKKEQVEDVTETEEDEEQTVDLITKANAAAIRQETANAEHKALLDRQERMTVESKLSGQTTAGAAATDKKEETDAEYAAKVMGGSL